MEAILFKLSGRTAFFRKPDVNTGVYFTYNNIHKVALLGLLGAVIGLEGYNEQYIKSKKNIDVQYPEFYEKLKNLKISITPFGTKGYFTKKIQVFNNTVGYANKDKDMNPCNLVVHEQWLENPKWQIGLLNDNSIDKDIYEKLKDYLLNRKCVYIPYLGKNNHFAQIEDVKVVNIKETEDFNHIDSLFEEELVDIGDEPFDEEEDIFFFREYSPCSLNKDHNYYEFKKLCYTNLEIVKTNGIKNIFQYRDENLAFY